MWLQQNSLSETIYILCPMGFASIMTFGLMYFLNLKIDYFNIGVFPTLIGMGDDCGLHLYCHWKHTTETLETHSAIYLSPLP